MDRWRARVECQIEHDALPDDPLADWQKAAMPCWMSGTPTSRNS